MGSEISGEMSQCDETHRSALRGPNWTNHQSDTRGECHTACQDGRTGFRASAAGTLSPSVGQMDWIVGHILFTQKQRGSYLSTWSRSLSDHSPHKSVECLRLPVPLTQWPCREIFSNSSSETVVVRTMGIGSVVLNRFLGEVSKFFIDEISIEKFTHCQDIFISFWIAELLNNFNSTHQRYLRNERIIII